MIRIKDIAQRAGVSATTVSNVIHGNTKKVSQATIDKINRIIEETNYVPSMGARLLAGNGSRIIGVLVGTEENLREEKLQDPFTGSILGTIETELSRRGYYMMFHISGGMEENCQLASAWNVEGLLTIGVSEEDNLRIRSLAKAPVVSIDVYYGKRAIPNVGLDDFSGGYEMTKYLLKKGHRRILFLSPCDVGVERKRWEGVKKALREYRIDDVEEHRLLISFDRRERMEQHRRNIERYKAHTALFFSSDFYAAEGMQFLHDEGVSVPGDISVAGFDNNSYATLMRPELTTVGQDVREKGLQAVEMLMKLIENGSEDGVDTQRQLPIRIVERASVRQIKE